MYLIKGRKTTCPAGPPPTPCEVNRMQAQCPPVPGMGMGTAWAVAPGNMARTALPFPPGMPNQPEMEQYGQQRQSAGDPSGRVPICQECVGNPNALCVQMQGKNMGMGGGMGMPPNLQYGNIPNAPYLPPQGGMARTPCIECGNIPNPPCLPPGGIPCPNPKNTPCVECANLENPFCARTPEPDGNYQEIGASMGGNSLTIRVHKDKNKIEQVDPNASSTLDSNSEAECCCSQRQAGRKKQGKTMEVRPGVQQGNRDTPFSIRMGKSGGCPDNNVTVNPPVATAPDGTKFTEFSDPNKELFILRVGKKSEGIDKKQNLELELCTPRGKVL